MSFEASDTIFYPSEISISIQIRRDLNGSGKSNKEFKHHENNTGVVSNSTE